MGNDLVAAPPRTTFKVCFLFAFALPVETMKPLKDYSLPNRLEADLWFLEFLKVKWEADLLAVRLFSCGTSFQFVFRRESLFLLLKLGFIKFFLYKAYS